VKRWLDDHPTARGFLIIAAIALVVVVLNLYVALATAGALLRIAFFLAIAFFIYLAWRDRRAEIAVWPRRALVAFYGGAIVAVAAFGNYVLNGAHGLDAVAFIVIVALCGFSMWRAWRDQHSYS